MEKIKAIALNSQVFSKAGIFILFLAISLLAPFIKIQLITGTIVNCILFLSVIYLGIEAGILIGFLPSLVSAASGLLPPPLLPMIPYIITGNAILALTFGFIRKKNFWAGAVLASFLKFGFLLVSSSVLISFFLHKNLPQSIIGMMSLPQLETALLGAVLAYILSSFFNIKNGK